MTKIDIGIAEDHAMVRQGFVRMLEDQEDINILFECSNGFELLTYLEQAVPQVILLDIEMPIINGRKAIEKIKKDFPQIKVIIISAYTDDESIIQNVRLGADCFLTKHSESLTLIQAIYSVIEDGYFFEDHILQLLVKNQITPPGSFKKLSSKEVSILRYLCADRSTEDIANILNIQFGTVRWYKHRILLKTGSADLSELKKYAQKFRYISKD